VEEYLTIAELAHRLKIKPKTVQNKMASGVFRQGVHYFRPPGMGPRFKWSAVVSWVEHRHEHAECRGSTTAQYGKLKSRGIDIADELAVKRT
jgi:hypothetical protein